MSGLGVSVGSGARALGMGGAFIAVADDATASSWNPAGLAVLEKPEASVVWKARDRLRADRSPQTFEFRQFEFLEFFPGQFLSFNRTGTRASTGSVDSSSTRAFDFLSMTYPLHLGRVKLVPQVNYQRAIDQGGKTEPVRAQHQTSHGNVDGVISGKAFSFSSDEVSNCVFSVAKLSNCSPRVQRTGGIDIWSASLAVSPHSKILLGVSLNWWRNGVDVQEAFGGDDSSCDTQEESTASGSQAQISCDRVTFGGEAFSQTKYRGFNVNLGALFRPTQRLRLGFVYKTSFSMSLENTSTGAEQSLFRVAKADGHTFEARNSVRMAVREAGRINWPRTLGFGIAFLPLEVLTLSADFTTSRWSKAEYTYTSEDDFENYAEGLFGPDEPNLPVLEQRSIQAQVLWPTFFKPEGFPHAPTDTQQFRRQRDTYQGRFGLEYLVRKKKIVIPLRAGSFVDRLYFTDTEGRHIFNLGWTLGAGVIRSGISLDVTFVRQVWAYPLNIRLETPEEFTQLQVQRSARDNRYESTKIYVSTTVRF